MTSGKEYLQYQEELKVLAKVIPETTWAYFAGMLDGEGYIALTRHHKKKASKRGYEIEPYMNVCGQNQENIYALQRMLGLGRVHIVQHKRQMSELAAAYLLFNVSELKVILPKILPYAVQKKSRLLVMSNFIDYRSQPNKDPLERELRYFELEKQFEDALVIEKPWLLKPVRKRANPHKFVTPPPIIQELLAKKASIGDKKGKQ